MPMTKRERELAFRHLDQLTDARDEAWRDAHRDGSWTQEHLNRHEALGYAIKVIRAQLDADQAPAEVRKPAA